MSLYKRGNVYWSAIWVKGVRQLRSLETTNRREAERREHLIKEELESRTLHGSTVKPEMPFGELYARFLAEGDVKLHHKDRAKHFLPFFAEMLIGEISKNDMVRYRKWRHEEHVRNKRNRRSKPLSEATINRDSAVIRHLLYWGMDEGFISANPLARFRMTRERRQRRTVVSVTQELTLLPVCAPHLATLIVVALDTGMRRGELLAQRWEDTDFDRQLLFVTKSKTPEGEMREIPLTTRVFEIFLALRQASGLIFTYEGEPIKTLKTGWKSALRRAKLPHFRFHDLRHSNASRLVECGVVEAVRKALLGHSSGGDVHSIYTHVELPLLRDAVERLAAWHTKHVELALSQLKGRPERPPSTINAPQPKEVL